MTDVAGHAYVTVVLANGLAMTNAVITKLAHSEASCKRDQPVMQAVPLKGGLIVVVRMMTS